MNKTIWAIAFVVLACGTAFAIENASVAEGTQSKWTGPTTTGSYVTEGGNVTDLNLSSNVSTEKWAGLYGNVSGTLVLTEEALTSAYMYTWTYDVGSGGTVCASTGINPDWTTVAGALAGSLIDGATAWAFNAADSDSGTLTLNESGVVTVNGAPLAASDSVISTGGWETVLVGTGAATDKNEFAFCVNITEKSNFKGDAVNFQMMVPTNETVLTYETYYFFLELA